MSNDPDAIFQELLGVVEQIVGDPSRDPAQKLNAIRTRLLHGYLRVVRDMVLAAHGPVVQGGPFAGMRYHEQQFEGCHIPKLLGCYEQELHPILVELQKTPYDRILDIGCADGYYAVGLARLFPEARIFAFDIDETGQQACRMLADLNNVSQRISIGGRLTPGSLNHLIEGRVLVFCDIEGAEFDLLDPKEVTALRDADIVVELHHLVMGTPERAKAFLLAFRESHALRVVAPAGRNPHAFPDLAALPESLQYASLIEFRGGPTPWAVLRARRRARNAEPAEAGPYR